MLNIFRFSRVTVSAFFKEKVSFWPQNNIFLHLAFLGRILLVLYNPYSISKFQTLKCTTPENRSVQTVQRSVLRSNRSVQTVQRSVYRSNRSVQTVPRSVLRSNRSVQSVPIVPPFGTPIVIHCKSTCHMEIHKYF
jgi:hypothetical protein